MAEATGLSGIAAGLPLSQAVHRLGAVFRAAGLDTPDLDARVIATHALGLDLTGLVREGATPLGATAAGRIVEAARRRLAGEPVARILGGREFWGLWFELGPDALVPRPDTETVVEVALARIDAAGRRHDRLRIADIGVGSGAILAALLAELPAAIGLGVDIVPGALATAAGNLARHGLAARGQLVRAHYADTLAPARFDLIVSNPPYIPSADIQGLMPEVARHDPLRALDGGADGLDAYRALAAPMLAALAPGGFVAVEIGFDQAADVSGLLTRAGFARIAVTADLGGNDRVVGASHPIGTGGGSPNAG